MNVDIAYKIHTGPMVGVKLAKREVARFTP